jgi:hypothetical protein
MVTQTFTPSQFKVYMERLPQKLEKYSLQINQELAEDLQRRIKLRAPRGKTGSLRRIELRGTKKQIRLIGPPHWSYVDRGVAPNHPIPVQAIELHLSDPGVTAGKKLRPFIAEQDVTGYFQPTAGPGKGFVTNSIKSQQESSGRIIERGIAKAIAK